MSHLQEVKVLHQQLFVKTEVKVASDKKEATANKSAKGFGTFFEKQKPPKFSGNYLGYCEWKMKWNETVHCHHVPVAMELGALKDNAPNRPKRSCIR